MKEALLIALLNRYEVRTIDGVRCFCIPIQDAADGTIEKVVSGLALNEDRAKVLQLEPQESMQFVIPAPISKLYQSRLEVLETDVQNYLITIAKSWGFRKGALSSSILKKAASTKPSLNTRTFNAYGTESDKYLIELINANMSYIKDYWDKNPQ